MNALEAIRKRRSVRKYTGDPIPRQDIETIVDAGRLAASGYNRQPWDFVVVTQPESIAQFATAWTWIDKAGAVIAVVVDPSAEFWHQDASAAVENMLIAATALGYGSCWLEGGTARHEPAFKDMLGIPADRRLITMVSFGVPVEWPTKEKKPLKDVLHWEVY
jgi:nitroreductase